MRIGRRAGLRTLALALAAGTAAPRPASAGPAVRAFEAVWVHLPRVPDSCLAAAWAKLPKYRPPAIEKAAWDRFRRNAGSEAEYYRIEEETTVAGRRVRIPVDPADPTKGHGSSLVPEDVKAWLVPDSSCFGDLKDPAKDVADPQNPLWKTYVTRGWRRILLRETFFDNLLSDVLVRCRQSAKRHERWRAGGEQGPEPALVTFRTELVALAEFQPSEAERQAGARFVEFFETAPGKPLTRNEWEKIPEFGEENLSLWLQVLAEEGDYSSLPVVVKGSAARVALRTLAVRPR